MLILYFILTILFKFSQNLILILAQYNEIHLTIVIFLKKMDIFENLDIFRVKES